jgi:hypothetical protein
MIIYTLPHIRPPHHIRHNHGINFSLTPAFCHTISYMIFIPPYNLKKIRTKGYPPRDIAFKSHLLLE